MAGFKGLDDLIRRLDLSAPDAMAYLRKLGIDQRSADAAADAARGSTMALRARNAQRPFFDELADMDLTPEPQLTPRDIARRANDDARRDAQYGPFEAGSPGVMWDIKRSAERGIDEARAAAAQAEQYKPVLASQLANDAATAALVLGGGAAATTAAIEAARASSDPPEVSGRTPEQKLASAGLAANLPAVPERARAGLFANLPAPTEQASTSPAPPPAAPPALKPYVPSKYPRTSPDFAPIAQAMATERASGVMAPDPAILEDKKLGQEESLSAADMTFAVDPETAQPPPPNPVDYARKNRVEQDGRYWANSGVRERKIARMAKKAGLTMEEARALVADGGVRADGMTDDAFNLTSQGRAEEFRGLRDAVTDKRNADANARMERYKAQAMLAGANPNKNLVNALGMLAPEDQQSALQFMLAGRRGATPLDVDAQQAFANRGIAQAQVENEGRLAQLQAEMAAKQDMFDKQLAQSGMQLTTDRELRLEAMERQSKDALDRIAAETSARAAQSQIDNDARMQAALAQIMGSNRNAQIEADARLQGTRLEADAMRERFAKPAEMMQVQAALASKNAERRANLMAAAQQEANNYGYDTGSWVARALTPGWDSALVTKPEQDKIRAYLRAVDPQATNAEIEQVLTAALRNKKREM